MADRGVVTREADFKGQLGWISYEMGGGPYYNLIRIFVFAPYFASVLVGNGVKGQEIWGYVESASGLAVALLAAPLGAMAEAYGPRKPGIALFTVIVAAGLFYLWTAAPGTPVMPVAITLVIVAAAAEYAYLYHNSLLALVTAPRRVGLVSGIGYSANYLGTLIVILWWLTFVKNAPIAPFGLERATAEDVRIVGPIAAAWFVLCALPFFLFTPDVVRLGPSIFRSLGLGLASLGRTISHIRHYSNIARYLVARMIYYDGLVATYTFTGVFAAGIFGWDVAKVSTYGLVVFSVLVFAGVLGGAIDDLIGSKNTILIGLFAVILSLLFAIGLGPDHWFYTHAISASANDQGLPIVGGILKTLGFKHFTEQAFVVNGTLGGVFLGPSLASSRTMLARLAPTSMMAEFFGFYTLTGKATSFIAPAAIALITHVTHSQRAGFGVVIAFITAGLLGMLKVREERSEVAVVS